jgi:chitinase
MSSSHARRLRFAAAATLLPAALTVVTTGSAHAVGAFPAHYAAPYLELSSSTVGDMAADMNATGNKFYTLAFIIPQSGCTGMWEAGNYPVGSFTTEINNLKNAGGNVIISFGGAAGGELAQTCTSVSSLQAAYQNIVNTYGVTRLDFDIEGGVIGDTTSNARRDQALAALQAANPSVQVDYTLAVDPNGLTAPQLSVLNDAKAKGVKVNAVNIMAMDFGAGTNDLAAAESSARGTVGQLQSIFGISATQAWNMLGITPIAGTNDDGTYFSQSDAVSLEQFAAANGVQELAFWEVDHYDKATGYAYTRAFTAITGGSTGGTGPSAFSTVQAENYSSQSGTQTEATTDTGGGSDVGHIANGDWLAYNGVTFGSAATGVTVRVASGAASTATGTIQVRLDSTTGAVVGSIAMTPTGGWQTWVSKSGTTSSITGTHTVYLTFSSSQTADFVNVNWLTFTGSAASNVVSFRAHANNMYVTADNAGASPLIANKTAIGTWEQFDRINNSDGSVSFRAHANNQFVCADNYGNNPLIANRTTIGAWEAFDLIHNADGSYSLRSHSNNLYVTADNAGSSPLIANRTAIGAWEEFDLIAS